MGIIDIIYNRRRHAKDRQHYGKIYGIFNLKTKDWMLGGTTGAVRANFYARVAEAGNGGTAPIHADIRSHGKRAYAVRLLYECQPDEDLIAVRNMLLETFRPPLNTQMPFVAQVPKRHKEIIQEVKKNIEYMLTLDP